MSAPVTTQAGTAGPPTARWVALDLLMAVDTSGAYANLALPRLLGGLPERERAFATELGYGALRAQGTLDHLVDLDAARPVATLEPAVRAALRLGAYQLWALRTPAYAAVGETVGLVPPRARGFVNAVLRRTAERCAGSDPLGLAGLEPREALALEHAHPRWIVDAFADALADPAAPADIEELAAALAADSARPSVTLLAVPGRMAQAELAAECAGQPGRLSPYAVVLPRGNPEDLASVRRGAGRVQDEGSQLCALALHLAMPPGGLVVDLTAGPGGKAALLAGLGHQVVALDLHEHRARLVRGAGLTAVATADGRRPPLGDGCADAVLLDAPCSGLGALRRRPEARWRRQPGDIPGLVALQRELLAGAVRLVRPGGVLAYAVCSPHLAEAAAEAPAGFTPLDVPALLGLGADARAPRDTLRLQLWPHRHGTDAMSMTLFQREG